MSQTLECAFKNSLLQLTLWTQVRLKANDKFQRFFFQKTKWRKPQTITKFTPFFEKYFYWTSVFDYFKVQMPTCIVHSGQLSKIFLSEINSDLMDTNIFNWFIRHKGIIPKSHLFSKEIVCAYNIHFIYQHNSENLNDPFLFYQPTLSQRSLSLP